MQAWQIAPPCQHIRDFWFVMDPCRCQRFNFRVSDGLLILPCTSCLPSRVAVCTISHSGAVCADAAIARATAIHKHSKLPPMLATFANVRLKP